MSTTKVEYKGFTFTKQDDGRFHAVNAETNEQFIVEADELTEAFASIDNAAV